MILLRGTAPPPQLWPPSQHALPLRGGTPGPPPGLHPKRGRRGPPPLQAPLQRAPSAQRRR
eukprot:2756407-Lingulodinium_polyedra.AAC.1